MKRILTGVFVILISLSPSTFGQISTAHRGDMKLVGFKHGPMLSVTRTASQTNLGISVGDRFPNFTFKDAQGREMSIHPDDFPAYRDAIVAHFRGRTDHVECEYRVCRRPGDSYSWVLDRGVAVRYVGAVSDITARKQTEIGLREAKEQVAQQLAVIREVFGKYVPESIATAIVAGKGTLKPTQAMATILYSDIEAFTSITEQMAPAHVVEMLNEHFPAVIEPITRYGGTVNQFQGDAMLVTFNVPLADPHHADNAVNAALHIQRILKTRTFAGVPLPTRIGINTGEVIAGNVGSGDRINYTVHGNAVNVAARLEQLNKDYGTHVLIAESTVAALSDAYSIESIGEVKIRGNNAPAQIFKLAA